MGRSIWILFVLSFVSVLVHGQSSSGDDYKALFAKVPKDDPYLGENSKLRKIGDYITGSEIREMLAKLYSQDAVDWQHAHFKWLAAGKGLREAAEAYGLYQRRRAVGDLGEVIPIITVESMRTAFINKYENAIGSFEDFVKKYLDANTRVWGKRIYIYNTIKNMTNAVRPTRLVSSNPKAIALADQYMGLQQAANDELEAKYKEALTPKFLEDKRGRRYIEYWIYPEKAINARTQFILYKESYAPIYYKLKGIYDAYKVEMSKKVPMKSFDSEGSLKSFYPVRDYLQKIDPTSEGTDVSSHAGILSETNKMIQMLEKMNENKKYGLAEAFNSQVDEFYRIYNPYIRRYNDYNSTRAKQLNEIEEQKREANKSNEVQRNGFDVQGSQKWFENLKGILNKTLPEHDSSVSTEVKTRLINARTRLHTVTDKITIHLTGMLRENDNAAFNQKVNEYTRLINEEFNAPYNEFYQAYYEAGYK